MAQLFEGLMLFFFGLSWPFNIVKSYRARTARGKSIVFEALVFIGYFLGITGKIISGNISYVMIVYVLDILMVSVALILTIRNKVLDRLEDRRAEKEAKA